MDILEKEVILDVQSYSLTTLDNQVKKLLVFEWSEIKFTVSNVKEFTVDKNQKTIKGAKTLRLFLVDF